MIFWSVIFKPDNCDIFLMVKNHKWLGNYLNIIIKMLWLVKKNINKYGALNTSKWSWKQIFLYQKISLFQNDSFTISHCANLDWCILDPSQIGLSSQQSLAFMPERGRCVEGMFFFFWRCFCCVLSWAYGHVTLKHRVLFDHRS